MLIGIATFAAIAASTQTSPPAGADLLYRLDLLPAFRQSVRIGAVTSYDRTEGNDDGFSGTYSFVRKENGNLVLADLKGPGAIYRIHTPTPTGDPLEFYFDGESEPRIKTTFLDMYLAGKAPFVKPFSIVGGGGYTSYAPIPYAKSCKIVLKAPSFQFYDLNFATYAEGTAIESYNPKTDEATTKAASPVNKVFEGGRDSDLSTYTLPAGSAAKREPFEKVLQAGKAVVLWQTAKGGRIGSLRLSPAEAFIGKDRDVLLRITWDGEKKPAVLCPVGDFFGYAWGKPATGSCLLGTYKNTNYCNMPMPFDRSAKIELVSLRTSGEPIVIVGEVVVGSAKRTKDEGKFYAYWNRENPTTNGKPYTFIETQGKGHLVGLALQAQGEAPGNTGFFEGDDKTTVDGELLIHGTGSEDFFNGGWYDVPGRWDGPVALPLSGCMAYQKSLGRTGAYRFFIGDAYSFNKSLVQTIEHAPERNEGLTDYTSVAYLYMEKPPTVDMVVPSIEMRRVVDPSRIEFTAHWALPIQSFSLNSATLSRKDVPSGKGTTRCLSLRNQDGDFFGPPFIAFICDLPSSGIYDVFVDAVKGPELGMAQLVRNEIPIGPVIDLYAANPDRANGILVGTAKFEEGPNTVMFKIVDRNSLSKGKGFDLANLVFVKKGN